MYSVSVVFKFVIGSELFHNHSLFYCNASLANLTVQFSIIVNLYKLVMLLRLKIYNCIIIIYIIYYYLH